MSDSASYSTSGSPGNSGDRAKNTVNDRLEVNDKAAAEGVAAGKTGQPKAAARTFVTLDVKPWDDTTDMHELETSVRKIEHDGLVWGASKMIAVGFGVEKLQINLVVEDAKVSVTDLQEEVEELEEYVQSSDVFTMQKL